VIAFFIPPYLAIFIAQALSQGPFRRAQHVLGHLVEHHLHHIVPPLVRGRWHGLCHLRRCDTYTPDTPTSPILTYPFRALRPGSNALRTRSTLSRSMPISLRASGFPLPVTPIASGLSKGRTSCLEYF
jgi:hypothetical protein